MDDFRQEPSRPDPHRFRDGGNGDDGGTDQRLRAVELGLAGLNARFESELKHLATKEDLQKIKVWVLSGVLGGMALAATVAVTILKLWGD